MRIPTGFGMAFATRGQCLVETLPRRGFLVAAYRPGTSERSYNLLSLSIAREEQRGREGILIA